MYLCFHSSGLNSFNYTTNIDDTLAQHLVCVLSVVLHPITHAHTPRHTHTHKQVIIQRFPIMSVAQMSVSHFDFHLHVIIITGGFRIQSGFK